MRSCEDAPPEPVTPKHYLDVLCIPLKRHRAVVARAREEILRLNSRRLRAAEEEADLRREDAPSWAEGELGEQVQDELGIEGGAGRRCC